MTRRPYPEATLHELFEKQVLLTPDAVAVIEGSQRTTFAQLNARANQIAHYLRKQGARRGSLVGICLERSATTLTVVLGVLKAGAAYVPLDPSYPAERLSLVMADSEVSLVITQEFLLDRLPTGATAICLDRDSWRIQDCDDTNPCGGAGPDDPCFVIYTSGSTGGPRGVRSPHRSSVVMFSWMWEAYPFQAEEIYCQRTTLNFVVSAWEIFLPLLRGVPVVVVPDGIVKDPVRLVRYLAEAGVTRILLVPSLLRVILNSVPDLASQAPRLKHWVLVGEPLPADLARLFSRSAPGAELLNLYGCSETHSAACYCLRGDPPNLLHVPIGRPLANRRIYILNEALEPVPAGVAGEICIAGDGVSKGYIHHEAATRERFVPDPFQDEPVRDEPGAILFRTGDRGRYLPDGNIELLGRLDNQVQIRGFRVELAEVEAALIRHPSVMQCAVAAHEDRGEKWLAAYVVANGMAPAISDLREHLTHILPPYMVPSTFTLLDELPSTPNGKLDRRALSNLPGMRRNPAVRYTPARSPVEEAMVQIWQEILGLEQIGIEDGFFDLGGYSNKAMVAIVRLRARLGVEIELEDFFELQTIERLAEFVQGTVNGSGEACQSGVAGRIQGEIE